MSLLGGGNKGAERGQGWGCPQGGGGHGGPLSTPRGGDGVMNDNAPFALSLSLLKLRQ